MPRGCGVFEGGVAFVWWGRRDDGREVREQRRQRRNYIRLLVHLFVEVHGEGLDKQRR